MKVPIVVFSIQIEVLEKPITQKTCTINFTKYGIGIEVTLINNVTPTFELLTLQIQY
jgi:hypothetical protein